VVNFFLLCSLLWDKIFFNWFQILQFLWFFLNSWIDFRLFFFCFIRRVYYRVLRIPFRSFLFFSFHFCFVSFLFWSFPTIFIFLFLFRIYFLLPFLSYIFYFLFLFLRVCFLYFFCLLIATPESCSKLRRQVIAALLTQLESL
jgi:hypothetical protein